MFTKYRAVHFVGIGGVGMSGIAEVLYNLGYEVTGSDARESDAVRRLRGLGVKVFIGHDAANVANAHVVVTSSAVSGDNPEVKAARACCVPVIPRAEMLAELGRLKYGVLVAGAHGKTTTTSLVSTVLNEGGLDPTVVIGGRLNSMGTNAKLGQGDFLVAEADESDGSFLKLNPTIAVITNIDREHMDFFQDMEILRHAFLVFINKLPFYGIAVLCVDNQHVRELLPMVQRRVVTYGLSSGADVHAENIRNAGVRMQFDVVFKGEPLGAFAIPVPGVHNVQNSLAAIAVGLELDVPVEVVRRALSSFGGIHRRFELKGEVSGIRVYDDYGHHPSEVKATLKAARESFQDGRLFVLFQPHRYSRTMDLMDEFAMSFTNADRLFLMDIYAAGERPIEGVSSPGILKKMDPAAAAKTTHISDRSEMLRRVLSELAPGDVLLTLGAGDVYRMGEQVIEELQKAL